jgi:transposase
MALQLNEAERRALEAAAAGERRVRWWRRYQALLRLGAGQAVEQVAASLGCARSSVFAWAAAWRGQGLAGVTPAPHGGGPARRLGGAGEALLADLLAGDPQGRGHHATGWTVPLLRTELALAGYSVGERTIRRALHRRGWRWKRPKYVLGRPDPDYAEKKARWRSA